MCGNMGWPKVKVELLLNRSARWATGLLCHWARTYRSLIGIYYHWFQPTNAESFMSNPHDASSHYPDNTTLRPNATTLRPDVLPVSKCPVNFLVRLTLS